MFSIYLYATFRKELYSAQLEALYAERMACVTYSECIKCNNWFNNESGCVLIIQGAVSFTMMFSINLCLVPCLPVVKYVIEYTDVNTVSSEQTTHGLRPKGRGTAVTNN